MQLILLHTYHDTKTHIPSSFAVVCVVTVVPGWKNFHVVLKACLGFRHGGKLKFGWVVPEGSPVVGVSSPFIVHCCSSFLEQQCSSTYSTAEQQCSSTYIRTAVQQYVQQYSNAAVPKAIHLTGEQQPICWSQCSRAGRDSPLLGQAKALALPILRTASGDGWTLLCLFLVLCDCC